MVRSTFPPHTLRAVMIYRVNVSVIEHLRGLYTCQDEISNFVSVVLAMESVVLGMGYREEKIGLHCV